MKTRADITPSDLVSSELPARQDLVLQVVQWTSADEPTEDEEEGNSVTIRCFGVDHGGRSTVLEIRGFRPFLYVRAEVADPGAVSVSTLRDRIEELVPPWVRREIDDVVLVSRKEYWGFTNHELRPFAKVTFRTSRAFAKVGRALEARPRVRLGSANAILQPYETRVTTELRYIHVRALSPSGWIRVPRGAWHPVDDGCYECRWDAVSRADTDDRPMSLGPLLVASFDLECTSSDGQFPLARKTFARTAKEIVKILGAPGAIVDAADATRRMRECLSAALGLVSDGLVHAVELKAPRSRESLTEALDAFVDDAIAAVSKPAPKTAFRLAESLKCDEDPHQAAKNLAEILDERFGGVFGDPIIQIGMTAHWYGQRECAYKAVFVFGECEDLPGVDVVSVKTEADLLIAWADAMRALDPDLVTGYNLFGFDCRYVYDRAAELGVLGSVWLGRTRESVALSLSSIGGPDSPDVTLDMPGRVVFDLMRVVRGGGAKLSSFKLDAVACHHLSGRVRAQVCSEDTVRLTIDDAVGLARGAFVKLRCEHDEEIWTPKLEIVDVRESTNEILVRADPTVTYAAWGLVKDDISPAEIFACHRGSAHDRAVIAKYCVMDCAICNYLVIKLQTLPNSAAMAHVCGVPLAFIFSRGQGIKVFSLISRRCGDLGFVVPSRAPVQARGAGGGDEEGYEGAIVFEPEPGLYTDPVAVLDYASLYPSSIMAENISHDTLVLDPAYSDVEGVTYETITYDEGRRCRFAQSKPGVLPQILADLITWRKRTRRRMELRTLRIAEPGGLGVGSEETGESIETAEPEGLGVDSQEAVETVSTVETDAEPCGLGGLGGLRESTRTAWIVRRDTDSVMIEMEDGTRETYASVRILSDEPAFNAFQMAVLDALQLAYKVTSNSVYGSLGFPMFDMYLRQLAACTTAVGRSMLIKAKTFVEDRGARVVYGDTDSVFVTFPRTAYPADYDNLSTNERVAHAIRLARDVETDFLKRIKKPQKLEYEKVAAPLLILGKKSYVFNKYENDPNEYTRCTMGLKTVRSDCSVFVRKTLSEFIDVLIEKQDVSAAVDALRARMDDLTRGRVPLSDLVVSKKLNAPHSYANPTGIAHLVLALRMRERDPGSAPRTNDRVPYVHVITDSTSKLMGDHIENPAFAESQGLKIDYKYYITNQLREPILQILVLPGILEKIHGPSRAPTDLARRKVVANTLVFERAIDVRQKSIRNWFAPASKNDV